METGTNTDCPTFRGEVPPEGVAKPNLVAKKYFRAASDTGEKESHSVVHGNDASPGGTFTLPGTNVPLDNKATHEC